MFVIKEGDGGSYAYMVQLALARAGYPLIIDGIFGGRTKAAVIDFQKSRGLTPDGIVGKNTFLALREFLTGYTYYTVKQGDTLYKIAGRFNSSVAALRVANEGIDPNNLEVGKQIKVIYGFNLVSDKVQYNSLLGELIAEGLAARYPFVGLNIIGRSVLGRPIAALNMGVGAKKVFFNATHHANEWITTPMLLKYFEQYAKTKAGLENTVDNANELFNSTTLYAVPMVNPDGTDLVTGAIEKDSEVYLDALQFAANYPFIPFPSGWKANIRGTDLNLNYPAMWEQGREVKFAAGFTLPGPANYVGTAPLSEVEARAVYNYSVNMNFDLTLSLHTQGQEIYWRFGDYEPQRGREIGIKMAAASGYTLTDPVQFQSYGGYKDWFIMTYLRPGYTVEAGLGTNPLPISSFNEFYPPVKSILQVAMENA
ncbi:MAG: LysM peptidoglycan-binding domain-containing protein [Clostridia bacterium]|nr:LysM peptidoglycan-binding domain-containing protein [Clostridia bacterium]